MGDGLYGERSTTSIVSGHQCILFAGEPKPAGKVEGVGTSLRAAMMLHQQLNAAFQTGLRHSLDDSDHDAMFDLSENDACLH